VCKLGFFGTREPLKNPRFTRDLNWPIMPKKAQFTHELVINHSLYGLDIPHKSLNYKILKIAVGNRQYLFLFTKLTHHVSISYPFVIGAHFN
jgi:hypothetical protein